MLNLSSEEFEQISSEESEEIIPGTTYSRKIKKISKRCHKIYGGNKKKKCQNYNRGTCQKGRQCLFSHSFVPDIAKKICLPFLDGQCDRGVDCFYSHNIRGYPCRDYYFRKKCQNGTSCLYSHEQMESDAEDDYLKENEEYLLKVHQKGNKGLKRKFIAYIDNISRCATKQESQGDEDQMEELPQHFWLPLKKTSLIVDNRQQRSPTLKKRGRKRKMESDKKPQIMKMKGIFSIRFITKNRKELHQKLEENIILYYKNIYTSSKLNEANYPNMQQCWRELDEVHLELGEDELKHKTKININNVDQYLS